MASNIKNRLHKKMSKLPTLNTEVVIITWLQDKFLMSKAEACCSTKQHLNPASLPTYLKKSSCAWTDQQITFPFFISTEQVLSQCPSLEVNRDTVRNKLSQEYIQHHS